MAGPIKADRSLMMCKAEATYGVDPTPVKATNAILPISVTLTPEINMITRGRHSPSYGGRGAIQGSRTWAYEIVMPWNGIPSAAVTVTAPSWDPLLLASGYGVVISGGAPLDTYTYTPEHKAHTGSATIYSYMYDIAGNPELFILTGCRGNAVFSAGANQESIITFTGLGIFNARTNPADPGDGTWIEPDDFSIMQSTAVTFAARTDIFTAIEFDLGWNVVADLDVGAADSVVRIRLDRDTNTMCTGSYDPEDVLTSVYDRLAAVAGETKEALAFTLTTSGGTTMAISAPAVQYDAPSPSSDSGLRRYDQPFWCSDSTDAGDDYLTLVVTHS